MYRAGMSRESARVPPLQKALQPFAVPTEPRRNPHASARIPNAQTAAPVGTVALINASCLLCPNRLGGRASSRRVARPSALRSFAKGQSSISRGSSENLAIPRNGTALVPRGHSRRSSTRAKRRCAGSSGSPRWRRRACAPTTRSSSRTAIGSRRSAASRWRSCRRATRGRRSRSRRKLTRSTATTALASRQARSTTSTDAS
jgi:hypothetical protein